MAGQQVVPRGMTAPTRNHGVFFSFLLFFSLSSSLLAHETNRCCVNCIITVSCDATPWNVSL